MTKRPELILSNSQIQTYQTCPMMYRHQYGRRAYPRKRPMYFVVGSAVHAFLEEWYGTRNIEKALAIAMIFFDDIDKKGDLGPEDARTVLNDRNMVLGICEAYPRYYEEDFDRFEKFQPEVKVTMDLDLTHPTTDLRYLNVIDMLMLDHAGDWWIMETKTAAASAVNTVYFDRVRLDSQVSGEMWCARQHLGEWPKGVIYNVIKKPGIKLKKTETAQAYRRRVYQEYSNKNICDAKELFIREEIQISKRQLSEWKSETIMIAGEIASRRDIAKQQPENSWFPKNTGACAGKFGTACAYMPACIDGKYNKLMYKKVTKEERDKDKAGPDKTKIKPIKLIGGQR